jgi:hypothetical protein
MSSSSDNYQLLVQALETNKAQVRALAAADALIAQQRQLVVTLLERWPTAVVELPADMKAMAERFKSRH